MTSYIKPQRRGIMKNAKKSQNGSAKFRKTGDRG